MKTMTVITAVLVAGSISAAQPGNDLIVQRLSDSALRIEFRPRFLMHTIRGSGGVDFTMPEFVGAVLPDGRAGMPMIPYRGLTVDLRGPGYSIQIVEASSRIIQNFRPAPYPTHHPDEKFGESNEYVEAPPRGAEDPLPGTIATMTDVSGVTGELQGTLRLTPMQYSASARTLRVYDRIVIQVNLGTAVSRARQAMGRRSDSPLKDGEWYSFDVRETGIYKLTQSSFTQAGISVSSINDLNAVRVFGNGGQMLPEDLSSPRPDGLQEVARLVVDANKNGVFDPEDYILVYGRSPRRWNYSPATRSFRHAINYYSEVNKYFVTFGGAQGRQMDSLGSSSNPSAFHPTDFQGRQFVEEERFNLLSSGRQWVGQLFDSEVKTGVYAKLLPGYVATKPTIYRFVLLSRSRSGDSFTIQENGENLGGPVYTYGVDLSSIETNYASVTPVVTFSRTGVLTDDRSVLRITFQGSDGSAKGWLDWFEILYRQRFEAVSDELQFTSPDTAAVVEYDLKNLSSQAVNVFDVTDHGNVKHITGLSFDPQDPTVCSFQLPQDSGSVRELVAVGPNGYRTPGPLQRVANTNLHGILTGARFVIVTPRTFQPEAERLKQYREAHDSLTCLVVAEEDIINEYAGGLPDPLAVRDFLEDAKLRWTTPPQYVLLFGNGHYDYKNIQTDQSNWIPPYESMESIDQIQTYASDDFLVMLNPGNPRISVRLGRLPARTLDDARTMVDKIIGYENSTVYDPWRNRVTFVADDGLTSTRDDRDEHTGQAERLAEVYTPSSFEKKKIYIVEFPTVNSSSGRRKPTANVAIIDAMNTGSLIVNYTGHGNPRQWAHEEVFLRETSIPQLVNRDRLFFLVAATCDFARYDDPAEQSAGEQLLTMSAGGAIAEVTASRAVYSTDNSLFNNTLYSILLSRDSLQSYPRIGDAVYQTKQVRFSSNDLKYHLFGDPTLHLDFPKTVAGVDSINGLTAADTVRIKALSHTQVAGEVKRPDGSRRTEFTGKGVLEVFDAQRQVLVPDWDFTFVVNGALLYRGLVSVTNGTFLATVPIPKDVSYASDHARISFYGWTGSTDAAGFTEDVIISGTDSTVAADTTGPDISIYADNDSFRSGDVVGPDPLLIVRLFDRSGINTSTASVGHRLEATVSSLQQPIDLTDAYQGSIDTYQQGEVRYPLHGLPEGRQTISVKAWDIYNNSSQTQIEVEVRQQSDLALYHVFNFPNPMSRSTVFTFQRNSSEPIDVVVKIFTVAGRKINEITERSVVDRFIQVPWDGRDANGDPLANGVYFYKVIVNSLSGSGSREALGKLTMLR